MRGWLANLQQHANHKANRQGCETVSWLLTNIIMQVSDKLVELEMDNLTALEQGNVEKAILSHCKEISLIQVTIIFYIH